MKRSEGVEDKAVRQETIARLQQATINVAVGRYVRIQLTAPNDVTGLGAIGSIVSVHQDTAKRLIRLGHAAPVFEPTVTAVKTEAKEGEE